MPEGPLHPPRPGSGRGDVYRGFSHGGKGADPEESVHMGRGPWYIVHGRWCPGLQPRGRIIDEIREVSPYFSAGKNRPSRAGNPFRNAGDLLKAGSLLRGEPGVKRPGGNESLQDETVLGAEHVHNLPEINFVENR